MIPFGGEPLGVKLKDLQGAGGHAEPATLAEGLIDGDSSHIYLSILPWRGITEISVPREP